MEIGFRLVELPVGAFLEELVMRGYLITRLKELFGSFPWALLTSTALFAIYHLYQGWAAVLHMSAIGLVLSGLFVFSKSLIPGTIAHTAMNVIAFLVNGFR